MENSRFKFRAWDLSTKRMAYSYEGWEKKRHWKTLIEPSDVAIKLNISLDNYAYKNRLGDDNFILMQSTGLFDNNGKEIWEGDIISFRGVVVFDERFCMWGIKSKEGIISMLAEPKPPYLVNGEVIGNIYENPELLKEQK